MRLLRSLRSGAPDPTVAEGWELYARSHTDGLLGDEWNEPARLGLDVAPGEIVSYLDREVFGPFFGRVETMLEIGSGGGRFTGVLLQRCRTLVALDTSASMLELLRRRFPTAPIRFVRGDGRSLTGIEDGSVDAAFSYGVFVHLQPWDIYNYLAELRRVLAPGGKALIQHANTVSELGWEKFLEDLPSSINRHKPWFAFTPMTAELMRTFAERAGLRVDEIRTDVVPRDAIALLEKPADSCGLSCRSTGSGVQ